MYPRKALTGIVVIFSFFLLGMAKPEKPLKQDSPRKIPVIYCTDLYHFPADPDDHFDLASMYAISELDIKIVILDNALKETERHIRDNGTIPVSQMNHITGRNIPYAIGLRQELKSPTDDGLWQPKKFQGGVEKIIEILEKSETFVKIVGVGSMRDIAAAYNRRPQLFQKNVDSLLLFIGDSSTKADGFIEYNVNLDKNAYVRIMNTDLPTYWVPCFDGGLWTNKGSASYWKASHNDLLEHVSDDVMNFFIYALQKKPDPEYIQFIDKPANAADKAQVLAGERNLWCTIVFTHLADRKIVQQGDEYFSIPANAKLDGRKQVKVFDFKPVTVFVEDNGTVTYGKTKRSTDVMRFTVLNKEIYPKVMTSATASLLKELDKKNNK